MSAVVLDADGVTATVRRLAGELSGAYGHGVLLVGLLPGSLVFLADLVRSMSVQVEVDFLQVSAYRPGAGQVRLVKDLDASVTGRDVVLVDAAVDTGLTLTYVVDELRRREPRSVEVCALVDKVRRRLVPVHLRFRGVETAAGMVAGYGLGQSGAGVNLGHIVEVAG